MQGDIKYQLHHLTLTGEEIEALKAILRQATQYGYYSSSATDSMRQKVDKIKVARYGDESAAPRPSGGR